MQFSIGNYMELRTAIEGLSAHLTTHNIPADKLFDSKLVAYELVGNVLQHSGGGALLYVEMREGGIYLKIQAEKRFTPPTLTKCPNEYAERGRGLFLVDSVCVERTVTPEGDIVVKISL